MNKINLSIIIFFFLFLTNSKAQTPLTNYHYYNLFYYNPAMAGIDYKTQLTFTYGEKLYEQKGFLSFETSSEKLNSGIGFFVKSHGERYRETNQVGLAYNYTVHFSELTKLTTGVQFSQIYSFSKRKPSSSKTKELWQAPNIDLGVVFSLEKLKVGASLYHLARPGILVERDSFDFSISEVYDNRFSNVSISYDAKVSQNFDFQIAFLHHVERGGLTKKRAADFSVFMNFYKQFTIGAAYRSSDSNDDNLTRIYLGLRPSKKILLNFSVDTKRPSKDEQYPIEVLAQYRF